MTTHLKARAAQAGAFLALLVGGVAAVPAAAQAAPPPQAPVVTVTGTNPTQGVLSGGQVAISYQVSNPNQAGGGPGQGGGNLVNITVSGCASCSQSFTVKPGGDPVDKTANVTAPTVQPGQNQQVTVTITAKFADGGQAGSATATFGVQAPDKPRSVHAISGKVRDPSGKGVADVDVGAVDSTGAQFKARTGDSGSFAILATDAKPIAPGQIHVVAFKDNVTAEQTVNGVDGHTVTVALILKVQGAASPSNAATSAAPTPSAPDVSVSPDVLDTNAAQETASALGDGLKSKNASDEGSGSMLYVVIGALLVAAGLGAIVLVFLRRRNANKGGGSGGGGSDLDPTSMGGGPGVVPPSQGRFTDATRIGSPMTSSMESNPAAATMVTTPRPAQPVASDAPTMLQRPVPAEDEFPDPYGAPLPQQGGFNGAAAGGWDNNQNAGGGQYGAPTQFGQPDDDYAGAGQYGGGTSAGAGQYGAATGAAGAGPYGGGQERYDEHTSMYRPESEADNFGSGGYDQGGSGGGYGPADDRGQYGGGYGGGNGAGQYGAGAYGSGPSGGYPGGGYGQESSGDQGGYDSWGTPGGGIDSGNGYGPQSGDTGRGGAGAGQGGGQYGGGSYGGNQYDGGGQYGGGTQSGGQYGGTGQYGDGAQGGGQYGGGGQGAPQYGGGYDGQSGYDQGYDPQSGGGYGGGQYGAAPQQGGGHDDQYQDQNNGGYGSGRRGNGYDDQQQQPARRGTARPPSNY